MLHCRCFFNCQREKSPLIKLGVQSLCHGIQCSKIASFEWTLYQQSERNSYIIDLRNITITPLNSSNIVIKGGSLTSGSKYRLALSIRTKDDVLGMSAYDISTASPPTGGKCLITPPSGISLKTNFDLSCSNWKSKSTPLSYEFQYRLQNGLSSVLYRGANNTISASRIPPGNKADNFTVKFNVTVTDSFGISASPFPLTVQVGR